MGLASHLSSSFPSSICVLCKLSVSLPVDRVNISHGIRWYGAPQGLHGGFDDCSGVRVSDHVGCRNVDLVCYGYVDRASSYVGGELGVGCRR